MTQVTVINKSGETLGATAEEGVVFVAIGGNKIRSQLELLGAGPDVLAELDKLLQELERLNTLEVSVKRKAQMISEGWWDVSDESGAGGEIHAAITELLIELENESDARRGAKASALA